MAVAPKRRRSVGQSSTAPAVTYQSPDVSAQAPQPESPQSGLRGSPGICVFKDAPKRILMQVVPSPCKDRWLRSRRAIRKQCHPNEFNQKNVGGEKENLESRRSVLSQVGCCRTN